MKRQVLLQTIVSGIANSWMLCRSKTHNNWQWRTSQPALEMRHNTLFIMNSKPLHFFFSLNQVFSWVFLTFTLSLISVKAESQVYTSVPNLGVYTGAAPSYSGCSSSGTVIKAKVLSYSGTTVTIQVRRNNGNTFGENGTLFLKQISPCSSYTLNSVSYSSTATYVNITYNLSGLLQNHSIYIIPTMVSTSGNRKHTGEISIKNACPIYMTKYSQTNPAWNMNMMNGQCTINNSGCVISCMAMMMASQLGNSSGSYTPATVNNYLNNNNGYSGCSIVNWDIPVAMDGSGGVTHAEYNTVPNNWTWLDNQLALCRKVVVNVNGGSHWVLITARTGASGQGLNYRVQDPANNPMQNKTLANFSNTYSKGHSYSGNWKDYLPPEVEPTIPENEMCLEYISYMEAGTDGAIECVNSVTGIADLSSIPTFKAYPNPVTGDEIVVIMSPDLIHSNGLITLFDLTGRAIMEYSLQPENGVQRLELPGQNLANGLYVIVLQTEAGGRYSEKVQVLR